MLDLQLNPFLIIEELTDKTIFTIEIVNVSNTDIIIVDIHVSVKSLFNKTSQKVSSKITLKPKTKYEYHVGLFDISNKFGENKKFVIIVEDSKGNKHQTNEYTVKNLIKH